MQDFDGRTALVTGGARGIGRAVSESLGRAGAKVMVNYRSDHEAAEETARRIREAGGEAVTRQADMGDPDAVRDLVDHTRKELGPVTLLVNNAAYTHLLTHEQLTFARWQRFLRTNVDGPFLTTWAAKDDMAEAGGGAIVNVSSLSGSRARPDMIGYGTSKAALNQFTRTAGMALAPLGIRVNAVAAGMVATPRAETVDPDLRARMTRDIPLGREGTPEEIAAVVDFLLSPAAAYVTGEVVVAAGGVS
ncbi:SDR family NAD(P)-dependent oxidoreductase [Pseudonocardia pini]|uniref:SDR family NAD(P)-dependent oxidoreductase n=1 Tax=Pseudonocardia pini TaxID=2758030 RepID=UPI0015F0C42B|nr:glucose 1-dehydrogenase [Pseudonocardia pini]